MKLAILLLNILGTFLLSIEAIKLENFQKLEIFFSSVNKKLNPKINWVKDDSNQSSKGNYGCSHFLLIIIIIFGPISYLILNNIFSGLPILLLIVISAFGAFIIWTVLIYLTQFLVTILARFERYTVKGIIGLAGFLIIITALILQYEFE